MDLEVRADFPRLDPATFGHGSCSGTPWTVPAERVVAFYSPSVQIQVVIPRGPFIAMLKSHPRPVGFTPPPRGRAGQVHVFGAWGRSGLGW